MPKTTFYLDARAVSRLPLTAEQHKVASFGIDARAIVFGSPGSGKTSALRELFLARVDGGTDPSKILALAASREAANTLRDELALLHQGATNGPMARTLSSFAFQVLRHQALAKGFRPPELISGAEQDLILSGIIESAQSQDLGWPKYINAQVMSLKGFRAELRDLITVCLEYQLSPLELHELGTKFQKAEWVAASALYEEYLQKLRMPEFDNRHDASTLLGVATDLLENGSGFTSEVSAISLVLVDDAQELTPAARRLLKALVSRGAGLVLFGDPDTATLGFRAADPRSMTTLMQELGGAFEEVILRSDGSRRTSELSKVLANVSAELPTELGGKQRRDYSVEKSLIESASAIQRHVFKDSISETGWLARRLRELHLNEGFAWQDIAVVARSRSILEQLNTNLSAESVPVAIRGSRAALRDVFASHALLVLADAAAKVALEQLVVDSELAKKLLLSPFCGLDTLGLRRFRRVLRRNEIEAGGSRVSDELIAELFEARGSAATINTQEGRIVARFIERFFDAIDLVQNQDSIEQLLWKFWVGSPAHRDWLRGAEELDEVGAQLNQNLDALVALFSAANRFVERNPELPASEFLNQQLSIDLPEDTLSLNYRDDNRVDLLTPAGLIGRRYRVVILPQLQDGVWPNLKPRSSLLGAISLDQYLSKRTDTVQSLARNELPDELRMLHKAVGAASEMLIVSGVESDDQQVSGFFRTMFGKIPDAEDFTAPRYTMRGMVGTLRRQLIKATDPGERIACALGLARLAIEDTPGASPENWYGLLPISSDEPLVDLADDPEAEVWMKPSQIDDFLACPLHWFLNAHGGSDKTFETNLGILLHTALEHEQGKNKEQIWQLIEDRWQTLEFEADWLENRERRKAERMLGVMVDYLDRVRNEGVQVVGREVEFKFKLGRALVTGKVDRIERHQDGSIVIVDLKTSATVTSVADAQEHPQLGIYQLAFEQGAFDHLPGIEQGDHLAGAKLVFISGNSPAERIQDSLSGNDVKRSGFEQMVLDAVDSMALSEKVFVANVGTHCNNDHSYGQCKIHVAKAVTYAG